MEPLIELRCGTCLKLFRICRRCYRGHRYCHDDCRRKARRRQLRNANTRYRTSPEGRAGALDRKRYQRRNTPTKTPAPSPQVTHQGSAPSPDAASLPTTPPTPSMEPVGPVARLETPPDASHSPPEPRVVSLLRCVRCGQLSHWVILHTHRRAKRPSRAGTLRSGVPP